ncbi:amidohydrolase [Arthrobacter sp. ISL-95]|uniref:amidohydrolase n=1 Tax=Arthrobacter sp. ISL-95 TaxID=2819116 RepID=UPI001BEB3D5F|nr:amidohydrolase [Arthrobacter sp. ISL-95]MBT2588506.1 amidohydrolase [Arthrobacter sp. ISL-95]
MSEFADLCLVSGRVFDGRKRTVYTAVAVNDGRIVRVGNDARVLELQGPDTHIVDAGGGAILPGFVDAHAHAAFAGVERLSCDLTPAKTEQETFDLIRARVEQTSEGWITGGGWDHAIFPNPTRQMLDAIVPDRPVALSDAGHHTLWVNSKALEIAGIDGRTPQPRNGHIYLDADGEPTGYLNETAAELVGRVVPPSTDDEIYLGLLNAQEFLWSLGVTGWHEAILGQYNGKADCTVAYRNAIKQGTLASKTSGALWIGPGMRAEEVPTLVERFVRLREENAAAGFQTSTAKAMIDGVPHGETAALIDSYCSHAGNGEMHFDEEAIFAFVEQLDAAGFALHLHIMGDRGIRVALDAVEAARVKNGPGPRHHFAHLSMIHPDDAHRFGPLGITANMQALWAAPDPFVVPMIGEDRMRAGYPFRSLADGGADLAMGSDWPVSPADPWVAIHVAVNRTLPDSADVLDEDQRLSLEETLAAYTDGSASLVLATPGRVRVGERADLVVSTIDPFEIPTEALNSVGTAVTVVNGRVVFERE